MRKLVAALVGAVVLGTAGFAAASAVKKQPGAGGPSTTGVTGTGTGTTASHRVVICHRTGSKKNPGRTITVDQHAVPAHLRHGDKLGACQTQTATQKQKQKQKQKSQSQGNSGGHGNSGDHGKPSNPGNSGGDHGNSGGHGKGK